ncbi:hypothetical protein PCAR4_1210029 [Paraburkholderia caribensis]|nr:hypothetical protein PCAR4_1210029 [Paraburkholderia caribensis]
MTKKHEDFNKTTRALPIVLPVTVGSTPVVPFTVWRSMSKGHQQPLSMPT